MKGLFFIALFINAGAWKNPLLQPQQTPAVFKANLKQIQDEFDVYDPDSFPEWVIRKYKDLEDKRNAGNIILCIGEHNKWNFCTLITENPDFFQGNPNAVHIRDKLNLFLGWHTLPNYYKYYIILQSGLLQGFEGNPVKALKFIRSNPDLLYRLDLQIESSTLIRSIILSFAPNESDMLCSLYRDNGWNVYCDYSSKFDEAADSLSFTQDFSWHDFLKDCLEHFFDIPRDVMYNMESNVFLSYKTKGSFFRPGRLTEEGKKKALLDLNSIYTSIEQAMFAHPIFFYCTHKYGLTVNSDDTLLTLPEFERAKKLVDVLLKGFRSIPIDPYPSDYGPYIIKSALDKLIRNPKHALSSLGDDQKSKDIKLLIPPHSRPVN